MLILHRFFQLLKSRDFPSLCQGAFISQRFCNFRLLLVAASSIYDSFFNLCESIFFNSSCCRFISSSSFMKLFNFFI